MKPSAALRARLQGLDALVVEVARRAGATRLVTEDLQGGRLIGGVRIEDNVLVTADAPEVLTQDIPKTL